MSEQRDQVTIDELAISNMISIEALAKVLMAKGIVTKDELMEEVRKLKQS